eukprot:5868688-Prymnesium_polylepis.1
MDADTHTPSTHASKMVTSNRTTHSAPARAHTTDRCRWGRDIGGGTAPRDRAQSECASVLVPPPRPPPRLLTRHVRRRRSLGRDPHG